MGGQALVDVVDPVGEDDEELAESARTWGGASRSTPAARGASRQGLGPTDATSMRTRRRSRSESESSAGGASRASQRRKKVRRLVVDMVEAADGPAQRGLIRPGAFNGTPASRTGRTSPDCRCRRRRGRSPTSSRNDASVTGRPVAARVRSSSTLAVHRVGTDSRIERRTISDATGPSSMAAGGQEGEALLDLLAEVPWVPPSSAPNRRSNRNRWWWPTKSSTVHTDLPGARRSPRPSCCRNSTGLSVGRSRSSVSTRGTSTPSLNRSTENTTCTRPSARSQRRLALVGGAVGPHRYGGDPGLKKIRAMNRAWSTLTKPSPHGRHVVGPLGDLLHDLAGLWRRWRCRGW